jgi:cell division protein FtsL
VGAAARKIAHTAAPARPDLRLVPGGHRRAHRRSAAAASRAFRIATVCLVVLAFAGVARVSLAAQAAEASIDAWVLRAEVKAERLEARTLEADRSALVAPSRIEAVASQTLNMSRPTQVAYLQLPSDSQTPGQDVSGTPAGTAAPAPAEQGGERGLLATLMDLAAGEAQVLLVGDVGLGSLQ